MSCTIAFPSITLQVNPFAVRGGGVNAVSLAERLILASVNHFVTFVLRNWLIHILPCFYYDASLVRTFIMKGPGMFLGGMPQ